MKMSGLKITPENDERVGVHIGSGIGGFDIIEREHTALMEGGPRKISPFFIPAAIINLAAGHVSMRFGAKGPNEATATACTTSAHSIGDSFRIIQHNDADVMIAGGTEAAITPMGVGGFAAMRALSTRNDEPENASRPWDKDRDGFVIGEGAGILILEELEYARKRGAPILAEIVGYGMSRRRLPHDPARARTRRRLPRHAQCRPRCRHHAGRSRLRQCPRHFDADRRHARSPRHPQFFRRTQDCRQFHQVHDRASPRRRRRSRSRHHRVSPCATRFCRPPSTWRIQNPIPPVWTSSPTTPAKPRSNTPCRTPSASAAPTARCCSAAGASSIPRNVSDGGSRSCAILSARERTSAPEEVNRLPQTPESTRLSARNVLSHVAPESSNDTSVSPALVLWVFSTGRFQSTIVFESGVFPSTMDKAFVRPRPRPVP